MKLSIDSFEFYLGKITIALYWPHIEIQRRMLHIAANSQITYHDKRSWAWNKSIVFRLLGFGVGVAHNHCDNPNYVEPQGDGTP